MYLFPMISGWLLYTYDIWQILCSNLCSSLNSMWDSSCEMRCIFYAMCNLFLLMKILSYLFLFGGAKVSNINVYYVLECECWVCAPLSLIDFQLYCLVISAECHLLSGAPFCHACLSIWYSCVYVLAMFSTYFTLPDICLFCIFIRVIS